MQFLLTFEWIFFSAKCDKTLKKMVVLVEKFEEYGGIGKVMKTVIFSNVLLSTYGRALS